MADEYHLGNDMYLQWAQLINAIPQSWINKIKQKLTKNESNILVLNHHLIRNARILTLDKLMDLNKLTFQNYFESFFPNYTFEYKFSCYHE